MHHAEVLDALAGMEDNSFSGCLTDVPYGLGTKQPTAKELIAYLSGAELDTGGDFMGAGWSVPSVRVWRELLRVLRPGAHVLSFAGSRTGDLVSLGMRAAGFEVRDTLQWLYAEAMPKSLDLAKALDKDRNDVNDVRHVCRFLRAAMKVAGKTAKEIAAVFGVHSRMVDHWAARDTDSQPTLPTPDQWAVLRVLLSLSDEMDAEVARLNDRKGELGEAWKGAEVVGTRIGVDTRTSRLGFAGPTFGGTSGSHSFELKAPASEESRHWDGYGSGLKPCYEPVILARKPLDGRLIDNIRKWGCGSLSIDACRVEYVDEDDKAAAAAAAQRACLDQNENRSVYGRFEDGPGSLPGFLAKQDLGRWPPNVLIDETAAAILDAQSGNRPGMSGGGKHRADYGGGMFGVIDSTGTARGDDGGASRFFFCAKVSKEERDRGCGHLPIRSAGETVGRDEDAAGIKSGRAGAGRTSGARNYGPCVKPIKLDQWLATLALPPPHRDGTPRRLINLYSGTGSEMCGAVLAGWDEVVGVEREPRPNVPDSPDYLSILKARVHLAATNPRAFEPFANRKADRVDERQASLFGGVGT